MSLLKARLDEEGGALTDAHIRLVLKSMEEADAFDTYSLTGTEQWRVFVEALESYTSLSGTDLDRLF